MNEETYQDQACQAVETCQDLIKLISLGFDLKLLRFL
jgi:hypothetical protein